LATQEASFLKALKPVTSSKTSGLKEKFVQDNHSKSAKGALRGLHYQLQHAQGMLVRVTQGSVFDVAVDIRKSYPTFSKWFGLDFSTENNKQFWIPEGLAHGFLVTSESAEFLYKTTDYYHPEFERSLLWDDSRIGIEWPLQLLDAAPLLAAKDANAQGIESQV
jgi:dTDP-4-dehydrorhamnose 3,5-epimerase